MKAKSKYQSRKRFCKKCRKTGDYRTSGFIPVALAKKTSMEGYVWQIDPLKCTQCGQCQTNGILTPSASKCVHAFKMCGYCDLCGGFLRQGVKTISTGQKTSYAQPVQ